MVARLFTLLVACLVVSSCAPSETPAQRELRQRLHQTPQLTGDELAKFRSEITSTLQGRALMRKGATPKELTDEERDLVIGMFVVPAGMFDEATKTEGGRTFRVLNSPATSTDAEVESFRRLWIDIQTFEPYRFQIAHSVGNYEDVTIDLVVGPKK
jgi:hypothetical protein